MTQLKIYPPLDQGGDAFHIHRQFPVSTCPNRHSPLHLGLEQGEKASQWKIHAQFPVSTFPNINFSLYLRS